VSISEPALELLAEVVRVPDVFGDVVRLKPFSATELRRAIEVRHSLSGLEMEFPSLPERALERLKRDQKGEVFFRALHAVSSGNPSAALSLWQNSVRVDERRATVLLDRLLAQRLPELPMLDAQTLGLLTQLLRFGPMSIARLSSSLGTGVAEARRIVVRLSDLGLLTESPGHEVALALPWRSLLALQLVPHGARS
jgi:hypothetical protein